MQLVANARMYSLTPAAAAAWRRLLEWVRDRSGVDLETIDHAHPAPLSSLWRREDLGCVFMCGFPFAHARSAFKPVAVPIPAGRSYAGQPVYWTDLVVKTESRFATLADTFGGCLGYTVEDSQSGFNALRFHLLRYRNENGVSLYRRTVGPLHTPRRVCEALLSGEIDVGPLDSYAHDLIRHHEPELARRLRTVESTDPAPIPLIVAGASCPDSVVARLRSAMLAFGGTEECMALREELCLTGFAAPDARRYELLIEWERRALAQGYPWPA